MKKHLQTFIMGSLALFAIYLYYLSTNKNIPPTLNIKEALPINSKHEEMLALNYLNRLRIGAGMVPFSQNEYLKKAANNHANYLTVHHTFGHQEDANLSGYTGLYGSNRIAHVGYPSKLVIENVSNNNRNAKESVDGLMAAIYHRFAFLSFKADEIGIGIQQNKAHPDETSFVYNISAKFIRELCKEHNNTEIYSSYSDVCIDKSIHVPTQSLTQGFDKNSQKNQAVVCYPFNEQYDVPPAFFNELPDPLPNYDVSGFPISISFNPALFKKIELLSFELFDKEEKEIRNVKKYDHKSDPHQRLKKTEFVLFPLKRLEWNRDYTVRVTALLDDKIFEKKWSFHTRSFKEPLYKVSEKNRRYSLKKGETNIFYFPPQNPKELLNNLSYSPDYDIEFVDPNTLKLTALEGEGCCCLVLGKHKLKLNIFD